MEQPESLLKYQPSVKVYESTKQYHQRKASQSYDPNIPPNQQEIIDAILPPRDWTDHNNKLHIQYVSHQPATRQNVIELTKTLEQAIEDRQARKSGICGIRQELYSQTFDQLIRQVAIDCPERGLLLMRVRDERKMILAAYQTVFQSAVSYGLQKIVQTQCEKFEQKEEYEKLIKYKQDLAQRKFKLICDKDLLEKQIRQNQTYERQKKAEELKCMKLQEENMRKFLDAVKEDREGK